MNSKSGYVYFLVDDEKNAQQEVRLFGVSADLSAVVILAVEMQDFGRLGF